MVVGYRLPRAMEVVSHHVEVVQVLLVRARIGHPDLVDTCTRGHCEQQTRPHAIELAAELGEQSGIVGAVLRFTTGQPAYHRILPVDVDAIEHARSHAGAACVVDNGKVTVDVGVDAGPDEGDTVFGFGRLGKAARP